MKTQLIISAALATVFSIAIPTYSQGPGPGQGPGGRPEPGPKWKDRAPVDAAKLPAASTQPGLTYAKDIRPIFEASCFGCHGQDKQKGDLRLDSLDAVLNGGKDGKMVIPGDGAKSLLVTSVSGLDPEVAMPPKRRGGPGGRGPGNFGGQGGQRPPGEERGDGPQSGGPPGPPPDGGSFGGPGGRPGPGGRMPKTLTPEQVGLVRAWIDQGAK
jgi:hypothetical protein